MASAAKTVENAVQVPVKAVKRMLTVQGVTLILTALIGNIVHAQLKKRVVWYRNLTA